MRGKKKNLSVDDCYNSEGYFDTVWQKKGFTKLCQQLFGVERDRQSPRSRSLVFRDLSKQTCAKLLKLNQGDS